MSKIKDLLDEHSDCMARMTVDYDDHSLHFPCGVSVEPPHYGLADAYRRHLAQVIEADRNVEVLDEVERRIREQQKSAEPFSMAWRAHMADVMHVSEVRRKYEENQG